MDLLLIIWGIERQAIRSDSSTQIQMRVAESTVTSVLNKKISFPRLIHVLPQANGTMSREELEGEAKEFGDLAQANVSGSLSPKSR